MLTLIGLTNVLSTISTNVRMRKHEFALLMSTGMERSGLRRMLSLESFFCSMRALMWGLPIAIFVSWLLTYQLTNGDLVNGVSFEFPWLTSLICIAAIFVITFVTMRFSSSRLNRGSIIEAIRAY
jgi:putative ABC transport system permease protein